MSIRKEKRMKPHHHTTGDESRPSLGEMGSWPVVLRRWHQRLALRFARPEPRRHALLYLQAIISDIPRKNGWQIAEHAKQLRPYGMQRLLSRAVWDVDGVRDDLRAGVLECLSPPPLRPNAPARGDLPDDPYPVLVIDESGFPKRGTQSAGVQKQYCGATGRLENCQVGVFLSYVTAQGHALIDRELYLPEDWLNDPPRRRAARIPETVGFRTKPELAQRMVERARSAQLPIRWTVADTVYGHSTDLRLWLEEQGFSYALAVPSHEVVCVQTSQGSMLADVATIEQQGLHEQDWQRLSMSQGTKGPRMFDWAILPQLHHGKVDGRHWLVIRRCLDDPGKKTSYLVFAPPATSLQAIVLAIGARWHIEEDLENTKDLGLDHYEVRSYIGWYRHITLVLVAYAFLLGICVQDSCHLCTQEQQEPGSASVPLIPLTTSEVRHLLARLIWPAPSHAPLIRMWSWWRRQHQYWASYYHTKRRLKPG
jgi:SRSO17 transposase